MTYLMIPSLTVAAIIIGVIAIYVMVPNPHSHQDDSVAIINSVCSNNEPCDLVQQFAKLDEALGTCGMVLHSDLSGCTEHRQP